MQTASSKPIGLFGSGKARVHELAAVLAASHRPQAVIEFQLDGTVLTANENFLNALGYTLPEIQGTHHSMFVEPAYRESTEYRVFCDRIRAGQYDAQQYERIAKGGREIWIQPSCSPIFDAHGRPYEVAPSVKGA